MFQKIKESRRLSKESSEKDNYQRNTNKNSDSAGKSRDKKSAALVNQETLRKLKNLGARPMLSRSGKVMSGVLRLLLGTGRIALFLSTLLLLNLSAVLLLLSPIWSLLLPPWLAAEPALQSLIEWSRSSQIPLAFLLTQVVALLLAWIATRHSRKKYCCARQLREKAAKIAGILDPEYIIMGHCHETDLVKFPSGCQYINTGTWTKIFSRESSTAREEKELIYTRIILKDGDSSLDLMKWEGRGGTGRRANLIDG